MGKTLKQMRQAKGGSTRPTRTIEMCLAQHLVAEAEQLDDEQNDLELEKQRTLGQTTAAGEKPSSGPRKLAAGADPRLAEIDTRLEEIQARLAQVHDDMNDYTGTLTLRGEDWGAWRRWADEHPARTVDPADKDADEKLVAAARLDREVAYGYCNASDLLERLDDFAEAWEGDELAGDDWETIVARAAGGDLKAAARKVVEMHEGEGLRAPKSPRPSPATRGPSTA